MKKKAMPFKQLENDIYKLQINTYSSYRYGFVMGCADFLSFIKQKEIQTENIDNKLLQHIIYENSTGTEWFDNDLTTNCTIL